MDVVDLIYIFDDNAGKESLTLKGELYKYLIKVRRHKEGDKISIRAKEDIKTLYNYEINELDGRSVELRLVSSETHEVKSEKELHVAWCVIESKSIEKVLPSLCEIGVSRISFISCERSQKNFKLDFKRLDRIVEASMQQSGRTSIMEFDAYKNIKEFIKEFPDTKVFDFTDKTLKGDSDFKRVLIGCEGGFSKDEKELLKTQEVFRLNSAMVLRSESAVMAVASKILL
ncbi:16S rRNA (uracil(1498)-N(3))-methyltransferase [Sulfurimonas aquatica]|uniref:Ribosomal RNA small subunit methyltransferase E n=1 Tax=Sulfurimonas aquatica TaxID=2672570 RepID=A0A975B284_9BACT|nr:16S rRNA (uracil(1498)-N(3))-methyltransferase [Sulfurimonas aquatica]QSZ42765.1 16S rRNA (uracil(1498)-N(3))-methyltransferase [Sulfurimonas aquatica]